LPGTTKILLFATLMPTPACVVEMVGQAPEDPNQSNPSRSSLRGAGLLDGRRGPSPPAWPTPSPSPSPTATSTAPPWITDFAILPPAAAPGDSVTVVAERDR
jgi:hypothetical protein